MMSGLFALTCIVLAFQSSALGLGSATSVMTDGDLKKTDHLRGVRLTSVKTTLVKKTSRDHRSKRR